MYRIALAVAKGANAGKPMLRDPAASSAPRTYVFDDAFAPNWDESDPGRFHAIGDHARGVAHVAGDPAAASRV